jgi:uncharacterized membrane protein
MVDRLVPFFQSYPHIGTTIILAMLPISELRGAIPYAIAHGVPWQTAYIVSVLANFAAVIPVLYLIGPISEWLRGIRIFDRFFEWLFARTRRRGKLIERFEVLGLILFVAIPLPVTGAWTGAAAAFVFGVRKPLALAAIFLGICIAGVVVTLATTGTISFIGVQRARHL